MLPRNLFCVKCLRPFARSGLLCFLLVFMVACGDSQKKTESGFVDFIMRYERSMVPLSEQINRASWKYAQTGAAKYLRQADSLQEVRIEYLNNEKDFSYLCQLRKKSKIKDEYLHRQLEILYRQYLKHQADLSLQKRVGQIHGYLRREVLQVARNAQAQAGMDMGGTFAELGKTAVKDSLMALVSLRNEWARQVGFSNYYDLCLFMDEQDPQQLDSLFRQLELQSASAFIARKDDLPYSCHYRGLFSRYGQRHTNLRRNTAYGYLNMPYFVVRFFAGIGFELEEIMANSDFSWATEKLPFLRCMSIDRKNDIRILGVLHGTETDMFRLLACCGNAVYWKQIPNTLPYLLRCPASDVTEMGVASFFSRLVGYPDWLLSMGIFSAGQAGALKGSTYREFVNGELLFCRESLLIYYFERELYAHPEADHARLWQELNRRYLFREIDTDGVQKDSVLQSDAWAIEPYLLMESCQVHDYLLAELWAAQLTERLCEVYPKLGNPCNPVLVGNADVGDYLIEHVFESGACLSLQDVTRRATGKDLSVDSFVKQFCQVKK